MSDNKRSMVAGGSGISLGSLLAVILSWTVNKSILWCIAHAFCGWFYVIYYLVKYS
jgi:hypothetical protein